MNVSKSWSFEYLFPGSLINNQDNDQKSLSALLISETW